ncbi:MAG: DUF4834 domain-containing protein, partial [Flavobacterium sp.]
ASFQGVLRTILIILLIYYVLKLLSRILLPILMRKMVSKAEENFRRQAEQFQQQPQNHEPQPTSRPKVKSTKKVGEYIDYEEID